MTGHHLKKTDVWQYAAEKGGGEMEDAETVSVDLLLALASRVQDALGERLWGDLVGLAPGPGTAELAVLRRGPDEGAAAVLAAALRARAGADDAYREALRNWCALARAATSAAPNRGGVSNEISGGTQHGPLVMAQDITNLTFAAQPGAPTGPGAADRAAPGPAGPEQHGHR